MTSCLIGKGLTYPNMPVCTMFVQLNYVGNLSGPIPLLCIAPFVYRSRQGRWSLGPWRPGRDPLDRRRHLPEVAELVAAHAGGMQVVVEGGNQALTLGGGAAWSSEAAYFVGLVVEGAQGSQIS